MRWYTYPAKYSMSRKLTKEEVLPRFKKIHGDFYSYDNVVYEKMLSKVCITCPTHGDFWQTPADHLYNHGCPSCKADKCGCKWDEVLALFTKHHGNYYQYDTSTYTRNSVKMKIICPVHGEFWQKPELHKNGSGCKKCTANGGPGKYCKTIFDRNPKLKNTPGTLYFIELTDIDGTKFYKVGITMSLHNRFYDFIKNNCGKICWTKEDTMYNCFLLEQHIIKNNKEFKYKPHLSMNGGKTECLSKEIKNDF